MSLCQSIRGIVEAQGRANGAEAITRVRLEIGRLAAVEPEALSFAFDVVMRGSLAEGARLEIIDVPGTARCPACHETVEIDDRLDPCPACGGALMALSGDEMRVKNLEVI